MMDGVNDIVDGFLLLIIKVCFCLRLRRSGYCALTGAYGSIRLTPPHTKEAKTTREPTALFAGRRFSILALSLFSELKNTYVGQNSRCCRMGSYNRSWTTVYFIFNVHVQILTKRYESFFVSEQQSPNKREICF